MERSIKTSRIAFLGFLMAVLLVVYGANMYRLQVIEGEAYLKASSPNTSVTTAVNASRGSLLDRNGELLVSDRIAYNVKIHRLTLLKQESPSSIVLDLVKAAQAHDIQYTDTFPVTKSAPFAFRSDASDSQKARLAAYLEYFDLDPDITATEFMTWMRNHYKIDYTVTAEDARLIAGVRYEVELRAIINTTDYVFAQDVSTDFVTHIKEMGYPSVQIEATSVRQYHTTYAAHILGSVGKIDGSEYEKYKELGYSLNSIVGRNGAEYAFEEYLHGTDGSVTTYTDSTGAIVDVQVNKEAQAGDNIYLTIDIDVQAKLENSLSSAVSQMNLDRTAENEQNAPDEEDKELAEGAAGVVIDVKSGDVLALASYPSYDLSTLSENIAALNSDPLSPLYNRATQGTYNPGSTFKMVTALAGLNAGVISPSTLIEDEGKYTEYDDYQPVCWIYSSGTTHGKLNVVGALEKSCNYFFYWVADKLDITPIAKAAASLGLGAKTGIEIGERAGVLASREYKRETYNEGWWNADTLITAIGQGLNEFTPIQMANYVATIANGGTLYKTSILDYVASSDYSGVVKEDEPEVMGTISDPYDYFSVIQKGMRAVATTGTAASTFKNFEIPVAAKTGTVQSESASMNTGVFVCYAPADDPEIAIALVVEKGGSGAALTTVARDVLTEYFLKEDQNTLVPSDGSLVK